MQPRPVNGYFVFKNASMVSDDDSFRVTAAGDAAYFASSAENLVYAVEAATGKVRWTFAANAPPRYAPAVANGKVYFGSDDGVAWCLNAADGSVVWSVNAAPTGSPRRRRLISVWPIRTGVLVENGVAYFAAGLFPTEGVYLHAVNAETGKPLWTKAIDQGGKGGPSPQGYLLAGNDSLWVTSRVSPSRFDLSNGSAMEFYTPLPSFRYAAYRWYDGGSYALLWNGHMVYGSGCLLCFDPNKEVIDRYKRKHNGDLVFDWFLGQRVLFQGETAYIATDYHMLAVPHARLPEMAKSEGHAFRDLYVQCGVASYVENEQNSPRRATARAVAVSGRAKPDSPEAATYKQRQERGAKNYQEFQAKAKDIWSAIAAKSQWMVPIQATEAMILAGETLLRRRRGSSPGRRRPHRQEDLERRDRQPGSWLGGGERAAVRQHHRRQGEPATRQARRPPERSGRSARSRRPSPTRPMPSRHSTPPPPRRSSSSPGRRRAMA